MGALEGYPFRFRWVRRLDMSVRLSECGVSPDGTCGIVSGYKHNVTCTTGGSLHGKPQ